ncbi:TPA: AAA family ATPase [Vibrio parahaemolyticus]|nr:AAA family ATPase [Vibrio parahaemolyticus]
MIIKSFTASNVHGYLDFNIRFFDDINFLVGHNGCGKTTALRLMNALLVPNLKTLADIPFDTCFIEFVNPKNSRLNSIKATKIEQVLTLTSSITNRSFSYDIDDIMLDDVHVDEFLHEMSKLVNPVLISLDRKLNDRNLFSRGTFHPKFFDKSFYKDEHSDEPLSVVKDLIFKEIDRINRRKAHEDSRLKDQILLDAFKVIDCSNDQFVGHSKYDNSELKEKRNLIISTFESLNLRDKNLKDVTEATDKFFYELDSNIQEFNKYEDTPPAEKYNNHKYMEAMSFLFSNRAQVIRIDNMVKFIKTSHQIKSKLYEKVDLFEKIVNSFFTQTNKVISIRSGTLRINVSGKDVEVDSLSSGETQIITLFAHIIFNHRMLKKASFMIDEPELSLHLAWQEMFVESLKEANSNLQVILATHSPAIINGMDDNCVFVN